MRELLIEKYIKPSRTETRHFGIFVEYWFNKFGEFHSINGQPAEVLYGYNKTLYKCWFENGLKHRDGNKPAEVRYENGRMYRKEWYKSGRFIKRRWY